MTQPIYIVGFILIAIFVFAFIGSLIFRRHLGNGRTLSPIRDQLTIVQNGHYFKRRLLNGKEYQLFRLLEVWIKGHPTYRLFAQVSLGEILGSNDPLAFACVNSKRCDFVIIDASGYPVVAIEYQGSGHYSPNSDERDHVKRTALHSAAVGMVEVYEDFDWLTLKSELEAFLHSHCNK